MIIIAINLNLVAFIVLPLGAITLGVTIYFFLKTRESLKKTMESNLTASIPITHKEQTVSSRRKNLLSDIEVQFSRMKQRMVAARTEENRPVAIESGTTAPVVEDLKTTILQQQKLLNAYLQQVEQLENDGKEELRKQNQLLEKEIARLHHVIEQKDQEIDEVLQQTSAEEKMAARIDEVYREFEQLQTKMALFEKQAGKANNLAIDLEDAKHSYEQVHRELLRKHERMEEVMAENQKMRMEMNILEDKLADANLQRQQLQKKLQFLQEISTDMQSISDANKKLQTELRRIGELESMLHMMAEERDSLLRKKGEK